MTRVLLPRAFRSLPRDGWLLFATRWGRMFAYGFLSVVLVLYLKAIGIREDEIGLLLTFTLLGDTAVSLWITRSIPCNWPTPELIGPMASSPIPG